MPPKKNTTSMAGMPCGLGFTALFQNSGFRFLEKRLSAIMEVKISLFLMVTTLEHPRAKEMMQVKFEGSEKELRRYVRKHRFVSSRIILLEETKENAPNTNNDWKQQWGKIAGIWSDYDSAQEDFRAIRQSLNSRIPQ